MRALISRGVFGVVLSLIVATACGYDPMPENGMLKCGSGNSCPDNYSGTSWRCWRNGAGGSGNTTGGGGRGGAGGGGGSASGDKFIGHWVSNPATAKRMRVCTDGTNETMAWDDFLDIAKGTSTALTVNYYCDWNLDVATTGNATTIHPGSTCSHPDMTDPTVTYTWSGETLTLTSSDGATGTIDMSLPYTYTTLTGSGSCTFHFTGPMTKN